MALTGLPPLKMRTNKWGVTSTSSTACNHIHLRDIFDVRYSKTGVH